MANRSEPTQADLDAFLVRAGFRHGWANLESSARRMAEHACREQKCMLSALRAIALCYPVTDEGEVLAGIARDAFRAATGDEP